MRRRKHRSPRQPRRWPTSAIYLLCAVYVHTTVSLALWAVVPAAAGFTPTVIVSDSMKPRISAGDVVLTRDVAGRELQLGEVITFDDPARPDRLLTHRVVGRDAQGRYRTRGDANAAADSTLVTPERVRGMGRLLVPAVGAPLLWVRDGAWPAAAAWAGAMALAIAYMRRFARPPAVSGLPWSSPLRPPAPAPAAALAVGPAQAHSRSSPGRVSRRRRRMRTSRGVAVRYATVPVVLALAGVVSPVVVSDAAFVATTSNGPGSWQAATNFCAASGSQTITAAADTTVDQAAPTTTYGTATDVRVTSRSAGGARDAQTLMHFSLPAVPAGCTVTSATLRLYASAVTVGRIIEVGRADASWSEAVTTWNTRPGMTGTVTSVPSLSAAGWFTVDVLAQVGELYAGTDNGLLLRDSVVNAGGNHQQTFVSREGIAGSTPELVITLG